MGDDLTLFQPDLDNAGVTEKVFFSGHCSLSEAFVPAVIKVRPH